MSHPIHQSVIKGQKTTKATNDLIDVAIMAMISMLNKVMAVAVTLDKTLISVTKTREKVIITGVTQTNKNKVILRILVASCEILITEIKIIVMVVIIGKALITVTKTTVTVVKIGFKKINTTLVHLITLNVTVVTR